MLFLNNAAPVTPNVLFKFNGPEKIPLVALIGPHVKFLFVNILTLSLNVAMPVKIDVPFKFNAPVIPNGPSITVFVVNVAFFITALFKTFKLFDEILPLIDKLLLMLTLPIKLDKPSILKAVPPGEETFKPVPRRLLKFNVMLLLLVLVSNIVSNDLSLILDVCVIILPILLVTLKLELKNEGDLNKILLASEKGVLFINVPSVAYAPLLPL